MLTDAHPAIVIALGILLWAYLMGTAVTAAISIANLGTNLAGVRANPQNQRRAMRARVSAGVLVTCWTWPILLILWMVSGRSSVSGATTVRGVKTIRCSLRLIEAATENEAWGRLWSALLTSGITPTIDGGFLVWQESDPDGGQAHFGISLLPAQSHGDRPCRTLSG